MIGKLRWGRQNLVWKFPDGQTKRYGDWNHDPNDVHGLLRRVTTALKTKYRAEELVRESGLAATVFRPSVIFGDSHGLLEISSQLYNDLVKPPIPAVGFHTGRSPKGNDVVMSPVHVKGVFPE